MAECTVFALFGLLTIISGVSPFNAGRRSDDVPALMTVVQQLVSKVTHLEASNAALQNKMTQQETALGSRISQLETKVAAMGCQSGQLRFNPHDKDLITAADGNTHRDHMRHITFSPPFSALPVVTSGLVLLDTVNSRTGDRIGVDHYNVAATGFDLKVHEWLDSTNYNVDVAWMACLV